MEPTEVIAALWTRIQARDWSGTAELLADDVVVEWPISAERMVGRDNYIGVNAEYPEGWSIHLLGLVGEGDQVVSEVEVPHERMELHRAVSFWTVRDSTIVYGREYWTRPGSESSPEWRARFIERM